MSGQSGESPLDLKAVLSALESDGSSEEQVLDAYNTLASHTKQQLSLFDRDFVEQGSRLIAVTKKHVMSQEKFSGCKDLIPKALSVLGFCLNHKEIVSFLSAKEAGEILGMLSQLICETKEKKTCQYAFWCLKSQEFTPDVISAELPVLLDAIGKGASWWNVSAAVEMEEMLAIERLVGQCPQAVMKASGTWGPVFLRLLLSPVSQTHVHAYDKLLEWSSTLSSNTEFLRTGASVVKKSLAQKLKVMFEKGLQSFSLKTCTLLLRIFKEELHQNMGLFNSLLSIQEMAFRCHSLEHRCQAFRSWRVLIDILAEKGLLTKFKYMELIMRVFTTRNANTERVAMEKLAVWWHYALCLGPSIWTHFDRIFKPFLQFCFGNPRLGHDLGIRSSRAQDGVRESGRSIQALGSPISLPTFPKAQKAGLEVLVQILQYESHTSRPSFEFDLERLNIGGPIPLDAFMTNARILISALCEVTKIFAASHEAQLINLWKQITAMMKSAGKDKGKYDDSKAVIFFLDQFQALVSSTDLTSELISTLFRLISEMPADVLSAPCLIDGAMMKCHAHSLCELLLSSSALEDFSQKESFITIFSVLVECGSRHHSSTLLFLEEVGKLLDSKASSLKNIETLWRLWSVIVRRLQEHISVTSRVDQDDLWPNFGCMYTALLLPVTHMVGRVPQTVQKTMLKTWTDLYHHFARLAPLVSSAEANIFVEELSEKILKTVTATGYEMDLLTLEPLVEVCQNIVNSIDFSSLTSTNPFMRGISPVSSVKRRSSPKVLGNLHSFVALLAQLMSSVMGNLETFGQEAAAVQQKDSKKSGHLVGICSCWMGVCSVIATRITVSSLISPLIVTLVSPLALLYSAVPQKVPAKVCSQAFMQKLERLWQDMCSMIQNHFKGQYDNELLQHMAPLLRATFLHARRGLKNQTVQLWNSTFGKSTVPLTYPSDLIPVLNKIKDRTQMSLPGWVNVDVSVIEETPISQMSQMDSKAPEPVLPGMPSPVSMRGSLLHKDTSPKPNKFSPKRIVPRSENKSGSSARKKLPLDMMPEKEFVVITNIPKKRRVLTEHQKEVMRERRSNALPAMYNSLENSMDMSLMSEFNSDTQQDSISDGFVTDSVITVNSSQSQDLLAVPFEDKSRTPASSTRRSIRLATSNSEEREVAKAESNDGNHSATICEKKVGERLLSQHSVLDKGAEPFVDTKESPMWVETVLSQSRGVKESKNTPTSHNSTSINSVRRRSRSQKNGCDPVLQRTQSQSDRNNLNTITTVESSFATGTRSFTRLKDCSKDSSAEKNTESNGFCQKTDTFEKSSPSVCVTLVEETTSPKEFIVTSPSDMSIPETPTKAQNNSPESTAADPKGNMLDETDSVSRFDSKNKVQPRRLTRIPPKDKRSSSDLSSDDPPVPYNKFSLEPPVVCDEIASQGFHVDSETSLSLPVESSKCQIEEKSKLRSLAKSLGNRDKFILQQHSLFGFEGLLKAADKPSYSVADSNEEIDLEMNFDLKNCAEPADIEAYNPGLTETLRTSPLGHQPSYPQVLQLSNTSDCQKLSSQGKSPQNSQENGLSKSRNSNSFDPAKDSTLGDRTEGASRRKQQTPKRIVDPMVLRCTRKRKSEAEKGSVGGQIKKQRKSQEKIGARNSKRKSLKTDSSPSPNKKHKIASPGNMQTRRRKGDQDRKKKDSDVKEAGERVEDNLCTQDYIYETPNNRTCSTPLRDSTTRKKKAVKSLGSTFAPKSKSDDLQKTVKIDLFDCKEELNMNTFHEGGYTCMEDAQITSCNKNNKETTEAQQDNSAYSIVLEGFSAPEMYRKVCTVDSSPSQMRTSEKKSKLASEDHDESLSASLPNRQAHSEVDANMADVSGVVSKENIVITELSPNDTKTDASATEENNMVVPDLCSQSETSTSSEMYRGILKNQPHRLKKKPRRRRMYMTFSWKRKKSERLQAKASKREDKESSQRLLAEQCDNVDDIDSDKGEHNSVNLSSQTGCVQEVVSQTKPFESDLTDLYAGGSELAVEQNSQNLKCTSSQVSSDHAGGESSGTTLQECCVEHRPDTVTALARPAKQPSLAHACDTSQPETGAEESEDMFKNTHDMFSETNCAVSQSEQPFEFHADEINTAVTVDESDDLFGGSLVGNDSQSVEPLPTDEEEHPVEELKDGRDETEETYSQDHASPNCSDVDKDLAGSMSVMSESTEKFPESGGDGNIQVNKKEASGSMSTISYFDESSCLGNSNRLLHDVEDENALSMSVDTEDVESVHREDALTLEPLSEGGTGLKQEESDLTPMTTDAMSQENGDSSNQLSEEDSTTDEEASAHKKRHQTKSSRRKSRKISKMELFRCIDHCEATPEEIIDYVQRKFKISTDQLLSCLSNYRTKVQKPWNMDKERNKFPRTASSEIDISQTWGTTSTASQVDLNSLVHTRETATQIDLESLQLGTNLTLSVSSDDRSNTHDLPAAVCASPVSSMGSASVICSGSSKTVECGTPSILKRARQKLTPLEVLSSSWMDSKKRRVSFADPVISGESPSHEANPPMSPNRDVPKKKSKVRANIPKFSLDPSPIKVKASESQSQSPASQSSYHSTQDSQLESTDPVLPALVGCSEPLNDVLPNLTAGLWTRGLENMLSGNAINTIGDLASLPRYKVLAFPFKEPKVKNLINVLERFMANRNPETASISRSCDGSPEDKEDANASRTEHTVQTSGSKTQK